MPVLDIERQIEVVTQQIVRAKIFYDIWCLYSDKENHAAIFEKLSIYGDFLRYDAHAHFVSMVIHCAVVWDKAKSNVSLPAVSKLILDPNGKPNDKALSETIAQCAQKAGGLVTLRHEAIAHRSQRFDYSDAFARAQIVPNEIPLMLTEWLAITNQLRGQKGMVAKQFEQSPLEKARQLILSLGGPNLRPIGPMDDVFKQ